MVAYLNGTPVWTKGLSQRIDELSTTQYGLHSLALMEAAARGVVAVFEDGFEEVFEKALADPNDPVLPTLEVPRVHPRVGEQKASLRVLAVCGRGHNGGDGVACARILLSKGYDAQVLLVDSQEERFAEGLQAQLKSFRSVGGKVGVYEPGCIQAMRPNVILDALTGVGFSGPLRMGVLWNAIEELRRYRTLQSSLVLSIDIPSGWDADCWSVGVEEGETLPSQGTSGSQGISGSEEAGRTEHTEPSKNQASTQGRPKVEADVTVTFGGLKPIHLLAPGRDACGKVVCMDDIFPLPAIEQAFAEARAQSEVCMSAFGQEAFARQKSAPPLAPSAHKFDRGHVLVLGGSVGKWGAPQMAAMAALRAGAGWVSLATCQELLQPGQLGVASWPELTSEDLWNDHSSVDAHRLEQVLQSRHVRSVVYGPGMLPEQWQAEVIEVLHAFCRRGGQVVLDAGALVADLLPLLKQLGSPKPGGWLLTPHPGEWRRARHDHPFFMGGLSGVGELQEQADLAQANILYKSATPILATPGLNEQLVLTGGNPALGRAGSGDVLAGVCAALSLRADYDLRESAAFGYSLMSEAAFKAAQRYGRHSVRATDMINELGRVYEG